MHAVQCQRRHLDVLQEQKLFSLRPAKSCVLLRVFREPVSKLTSNKKATSTKLKVARLLRKQFSLRHPRTFMEWTSSKIILPIILKIGRNPTDDLASSIYLFWKCQPRHCQWKIFVTTFFRMKIGKIPQSPPPLTTSQILFWITFNFALYKVSGIDWQ